MVYSQEIGNQAVELVGQKYGMQLGSRIGKSEI